ncbi:MAG TPA: DUF3488 and transglutaminase-like domain-containing protein [Phycisphaerales bacterium]|nr:DUF3488 and transglutaminase-like domain-containing protein [Phycisphaerales bacterium]
MSATTAPRKTLLLAAVCAVIAYAAVSPAPASMLAALVVGSVGIVLGARSRAAAVPRWLVALATIAVLLRTMNLALGDGLDIHDFAEFVAWMMVVKAFDQRSASDDAQLLALSVFLCVASMLVSNGLAVAVLSFVYLPLVAHAAMHAQLRVSLERAERLASRGPAGDFGPLRIRPGAGPRASAELRRMAVAGLGLGFLVAAIVFVVLPRGAGLREIGRWGNPGVGRVVGFADRVRIGLGGAISTSQTPVLHMRLADSEGRPLGGLGAVHYLRGAVLDTYEDGVWSPSRPPSAVGETSEEVPGQAENLGGAAGDSVIHQHITLLNTPREFSYLFTIWRPAEVRFEDPTTCAIYRPQGTLMIAGRGGTFRYMARSAPYNTGPRRRTAREPAGWASPVVRGLAAKILAQAEIEPDPALRSISDDSMAINAFRRHFWSNYTYSLDSPPPPRAVDPIDWFLTDASTGHCEYYASALAALCRSVGIPARVVTGYVAAEYNATTGHYVVRESNAHAWVEAEVEPGVWKPYDATPPADLLAQHGPAPGLMARAGRALDALNYAWVNSVVAFDSDDRSELLGWSEPLSAAVSARFAKLLDGASFAPPRVLVLTAIRIALAVAGGVLAGVVLIRLIRRWRARLAERPRAIPRRIADEEIRARIRATPLYQEMLTLLTRRGVRKPAWQPPLAWSGTLARDSSSVSRAVRELTELYYVMRFGGRELTSAERADARRLLGELSAALGASATAGR